MSTFNCQPGVSWVLLPDNSLYCHLYCQLVWLNCISMFTGLAMPKPIRCVPGLRVDGRKKQRRNRTTFTAYQVNLRGGGGGVYSWFICLTDLCMTSFHQRPVKLFEAGLLCLGFDLSARCEDRVEIILVLKLYNIHNYFLTKSLLHTSAYAQIISSNVLHLPTAAGIREFIWKGQVPRCVSAWGHGSHYRPVGGQSPGQHKPRSIRPLV